MHVEMRFSADPQRAPNSVVERNPTVDHQAASGSIEKKNVQSSSKQVKTANSISADSEYQIAMQSIYMNKKK